MLNYAAGTSVVGYNLTRSLRFRASASAFLSRTNGTATNANKWTWSGWVKRGTIGTTQVLMGGWQDDSNFGNINFADDSLQVARLIGGSVEFLRKTNAVYRDPSAWYHFVVVFDNANATVANRVQIYVNGVLQTYSISNDPSTSGMWINASSIPQRLGRSGNTSSPFYFDGYMTEVNFIDGQALTPSSFGSFNAATGVWQPARYTGTYGTNGFYLPFTDNSALTTSSNVGLGKDFSGNGNYWTTNNISVTAGVTYDSMTDVPTLTSATTANYATLNPLDAPSGANIASGNLNATNLSTVWLTRVSTVHVNSGKYYAEVEGFTAAPFMFGVVGSNWRANIADSRFWVDATGKAYYSADGNKYTNGSGAAYGATYTFGDTIGIALDLDSGTLEFYKNGVSQGVAFSGLSGGFQFAVACNANDSSLAINFGQRPFAYTPPTGFVALNTFNLPTATILKGNTVMDATLYTGNGSTQTITNAAGFRPDLVWAKDRSAAFEGGIYDSVRGTGTLTSLTPSSTRAETGNTTDFNLTSFNSNGFSLGTTSGTNVLNRNGDATVAWQWQAGQGTNTTNTAGSITSTVSVNASAGFSVVTFTGTGVAGATVGHGLGIAPSLIITKSRQYSGQSWFVYHRSITANNYLILNTTDASTASVLAWNNTAPTSSVMTLGAANGTNFPSGTQVSYCWSEIDGFSKFGSYTGNNSADGTFVYLGFRPAFVMIKGTNVISNWVMKDDQRANNFNPQTGNLYADLSNAEDTTASVNVDFLSNGFKLRGTYFATNGPYNFVYMAFAENPFKNSLAR